MKKKALVVDNDFFFVEFLTELLTKRGYDVIKGYDGQEGITRINEGDVSVLFVDMLMPKIDGRQMIQYCRQQFPNARFPIIALSSTLIEKPEDVQQIGADYYIAKCPVKAMNEHIGRFMDKLEKQSFPFSRDEEVQMPVPLYPRQSTAELMEAMDFQAAVFESIGAGIFVTDKRGVIIKANEYGLDITQKTIGDVLNCHVTTLVHLSEKSRFAEALKKIASRRELNRVALDVAIDAGKAHCMISLLKVNQKAMGWIVVMESMNLRR